VSLVQYKYNYYIFNNKNRLTTLIREWTFSQLDVDSIDYLKNLPTELNLEYEKVKIHAYHATPDSLFEVVLPYESDQVLEEKMMRDEADIYIYGHTHKPYIRYMNGKCIINIGSVGLTFDGLAKSSYAILDIEENSFQTSLVRVNYDVNKVIRQFRQFRESNYPNSEQMIKVLKNAGI
jgi:putative phosphoesterase